MTTKTIPYSKVPPHSDALAATGICRTTRPCTKWHSTSVLCELIGLMFTILCFVLTVLS